VGAKLKNDEITAKDLAAFVATDSDFGFEMQVLAQLREVGFSCSHSGTYRDPVTDKTRQYDIRASMTRGDSTLALAVECKNLRRNNPLLLSSVPERLLKPSTTLSSTCQPEFFNRGKSFLLPDLLPPTSRETW
jgi:hypothetical protein